MYGGTKTELQRLIKDAAKLDKSVKSNDMSYANIVKAIHAVQDEMGITGTTSKEAEKTITGSLNAMKASWGNLLTAMASGENLDQCIDNMVNSVEVFGKNLIPVAEKALGGLGTVIEKLTPVISDKLPGLAKQLLPPLISATIELTKGLIKALPSIIKTIVDSIVDICKDEFPAIEKIGKPLSESAGKIAKVIPVVIGLVAAFKAFKAVKSVISMFKGGGDGGGSGGGLFDGITNSLRKLGKTKTGVIAKGMANLAIIVGGFALLTAACAGILTLVSKFTDTKKMLQMIGIMGALGVVAAGLTKLSGIIGKIPVATVAKGLANMGIVVLGMSALFLLMGALSLVDFDYKKITHVTKIIGTLGVAAGVLTAFAGLVGMIPIPVVLAGLANMGLVLTGVSAVIIAFGALSEIKGFSDFISKGGEILSKIFNVIGNVVGSLIGGLGESVTSSLPKIGNNLSAFAESLKPMFTVFSSADMSGIGDFFSALGGFMLKMTGNDFASFFTGGTDYADFGKQLTSFAENSSGFFEIMSGLPANGFSNAKLLFQSLSDIGNVPKSGGIKQWFTGETDFSSLASGLKQLSGEGVIAFFNKVSAIPAAGFSNAKSLFQSFADIGNVPKVGGFAQMFTGENDFSGLAKKLPPFGEAMASFYTSISGIEDFSKITKLFKAISGISEAVPKSGGFAQMFGGENDISGFGESLKQFGEDAASFFTQVNSLNITNLSALPAAIKALCDAFANLQNVTSGEFEQLASIVDKTCGNILKTVKSMTTQVKKIVNSVNLKPSGVKMMDGLIKGINSKKTTLISTMNSIARTIQSKFNSIISGANWTLSQFGSSKKLTAYRYASGTDGHKGGNAIVNDGRGAELVQMPNGNTFIPSGRNVFIPNAPKGMKVLDAERTANVMGRSTPTFRYADGTGSFDVFAYSDGKSLAGAIVNNYVDLSGMSGFGYNLGKAAVDTTESAMSTWADKLIDEFGAKGLGDYIASAGVEQWRSTVIRALKMEGLYSEANVKRTLYQMQTESGGNPRAINLWDSNAKKGTPSKGLMQVIDPTFRSYARAGFNKNIYDPLSNILASIRYARARYGSLAKAFRGVGYANGGIATKPSVFGEDGAEMAIPLSRDKRKRGLSLWAKTGEMLGLSSYTPEQDAEYRTTNSVEYNTYSPQFSLSISGTNNDRETARKVKRWVKEALDETFELMERKTSKVQEV